MSEHRLTLLPSRTPRELASLLAALRRAPRHEPFAPELVETLAAISRAILAAPDLARRAEAVALGFWLRPANLQALRERFEGLPRTAAVRAPAGLVFHVPPANVGTIFVFSWALAFACGNTSLVRISRRGSDLIDRLLEIVSTELDKRPALAAGNVFITYDHDSAITRQISSQVDVRVVWGGDATVSALRAIPLPPHARDIGFGDRLSLSVLSSRAWLALREAEQKQLAQRAFADLYSFDQLACSSARLLIWLGGEADARRASAAFSSAIRAEIERRGYRVAEATALAKYAAACRAAIDWPVAKLELDTLDWVVIDLAAVPAEDLPNEATGGGLVVQLRLDSLAELGPKLERRVQTITHFGITQLELERFVRSLGGRGGDRFVPIGDALTFSPTWDGYDLFSELTRLIEVRGGTLD